MNIKFIFHILAIENNAAMKIGVHMFQDPDFNSLG